MTYTPGRCQLCGAGAPWVGPRDLICNLCWRGREDGWAYQLREPLRDRLARLATWERTGRPTRVGMLYRKLRGGV